MADAQVEIIFGFVWRVDLGARGDAHLDRGFDYPFLRCYNLWGAAFPRPTNAHAVICTAPLDHVQTGQGKNLFQLVHRPFLLDHQDNYNVTQRLDIGLSAAIAHIGEPTRAYAVFAAILWRVRLDGADASLSFFHVVTIGKEHALKARTNRALGAKAMRLIIHLDHHAQIVQFGGSAEVVKVVEIIGRIFGDKLDIVKHTRMADRFDHRRPRRMDVSGDARLVVGEQGA